MSILRENPLTRFAGMTVLLVSHDLGLTGSPLLLVEMARGMRHAGLRVVMTSLRDDWRKSRIPELHREEVVPIGESMSLASRVDVVIANTVVTGSWVHDYLARWPQRARQLVWWIHEIDAVHYRERVGDLDRVAALVVDSEASLRSWRSGGQALPAIVVVVSPGVRAMLLATVDQLTLPYASREMQRRFGLFRPRTRTWIRESLGVNQGDLLVALFGTYEPRKGQDLFVDTVERMRSMTPQIPLKALLIGFASAGAARVFAKTHRLSRQSVLSPERVLPAVTDLSAYYAASDAFVVNTQGLGENFGRVTTEAMAFRLPVCGTDAGGTRDIVDAETGLLHPVGVPGQEQLDANLRRLAGDRDLARRLGEAGHQRVRDRFTEMKMFEGLAEVLDRIRADQPRR